MKKTQGEKIREARERKGLSQTALAAEVGITRQTMNKYERDVVVNIPTGTLAKISEVLGVSADELISEKKPKVTAVFHRKPLPFPTYEHITMRVPEEGQRVYYDDETMEIANEIRKNSDLALLFKSAKDSSPEDLQAVHTMLLALKRKENND